MGCLYHTKLSRLLGVPILSHRRTAKSGCATDFFRKLWSRIYFSGL